MEISIFDQLMAILYSLLLGAFIGNIYNAFKMIRVFIFGGMSEKLKNKLYNHCFPLIKKIPQPKNKNLSKRIELVFLIVWDILFFIVITPIIQIFTYVTSFGVVRYYIFIGMALGFIIYYFTIGKLFKAIYEHLFFALAILFEYVKYPFKRLILALKKKILNAKEKAKEKRELKAKKIPSKNRTNLFEIGKITE